jgi:hypothetical protein
MGDIECVTFFRQIAFNLVSYCIFLSRERAFIVTVLKPTGKFTSSGTRCIRFSFSGTLPSFTVAIGVSIWMIGLIADKAGLGNEIALVV